ncbi:capsule biosynthesis protein [Brevirhabdus sp.]|uniref:capsule biosynthesis protein n=1 Tax=Brevirhabdus sp. TaxID=2004514 RepID=UPI0040592C9F
MKPRAKKFRIRRSPASVELATVQHSTDRPAAAGQASATRQGAAQARAAAPQPRRGEEETEDGFGNRLFATARGNSAAVVSARRGGTEPARGSQGGAALPAANLTTAADDIASIRNEGLTGRQLRMARRIAQKHGLRPSSDYDAVHQLRRQGIDPFEKSNMLELVADQNQVRNLPQTIRRTPLPAEMETDRPEQSRASEIMRIQRDIARRRKRRIALLIARLAFFVFLPTLVAGYYYAVIATPLYATDTQFVIQKAESQGASPLSGMFSGTSFATSQDSISVQSYLQSRDAMQRLDQDLGFKAHFQDPAIDPIQRLDANATNEDAYKVYQRNVKIGYDPTEGVVRMEVIATDPATSVAFSRALITYAEEQVDHLTQRLRRDQMAGANESYKDAEAKMQAAQLKVVQLQEARGVLSAEAESSMVMGQINTYEIELQNERLRLAELEANRRPNETRVAVSKGNIQRLEQVIADLRTSLTEGGEGSGSLARITSELMVAQTDLETRQLMLQQALQQMETARIEANRQTRYLSMAVNPVAPDKPTYPRVFENTSLAFLIFAGIYLMASLTASILREQVTS